MREKIVQMPDNDERGEKVRVAKRIIKLQEEIIFVKEESEEERRKMKKDFSRKIAEVKLLALGNKNDIKKLYKRSDDNLDKIAKLQEIVQWVFRILVGVLLTLIVGGLWSLLFS